MMRCAPVALTLFALACAPLNAQTSQPTSPEDAVPSIKFPLRLAYTRLHPDRVTVLDPRFDESPAEAMKILVVFSGGAVMLFDPVKNQALWPAPFTCATEPTLLALNEQRLIFATNSQVICVDRLTGAVRWRVGEKTSTNPEDDPEWQASLIDFAFAADRLICANDRRELICVSTRDGTIVWRAKDGPQNPGLLAADEHHVVSYDDNSEGGTLTTRSAETGHTIKTTAFNGSGTLQSLQMIPGSGLLIDATNELVMLDPDSLAVKWHVAGRPVIFTSTVLIDGDNVLVSDDGKTVTRYLGATGEKRWRSTLLAARNENVLYTVSAGSLILAATPRAIAAYDAGTGRRQWRRSGTQFMNDQAPVLIQDAVLTYQRLAPETRPASQPAVSQPAGFPLALRRLNIADGKGGDSPQTSVITPPLQSFGGVSVRNHAVIVLDGSRLMGYVDESVKFNPQ